MQETRSRSISRDSERQIQLIGKQAWQLEHQSVNGSVVCGAWVSKGECGILDIDEWTGVQEVGHRWVKGNVETGTLASLGECRNSLGTTWVYFSYSGFLLHLKDVQVGRLIGRCKLTALECAWVVESDGSCWACGVNKKGDSRRTGLNGWLLGWHARAQTR